MDIKLKSSNDNKEFNDSRNNINGIKKSNYKGKVVIATLLVIAIIATAALGMCAAYPLIEENAKNVSYNNYFEEYAFSENLAGALYCSYYNSLNEKAGGTLDPASTLLNIPQNI